MEHVSALSSSLRKRGAIIFRGPLLVARSFEGLTAEPIIETSRSRRRAVTNPGDTHPNSGIPLEIRHVDDPEAAVEAEVEETLPAEAETPPPSEPNSGYVVDLTVNRVCRAFTIIVLGVWGGWSLLPSESKIPVSSMWVGYICFITDWYVPSQFLFSYPHHLLSRVVLTVDLDCMWPSIMNWYFRKRPKWKFLVRENQNCSFRVTVTGYSIVNTLVGLGIAIFKYIMQKDQPVLTSTDAIIGGPVFVMFVLLLILFQ